IKSILITKIQDTVEQLDNVSSDIKNNPEIGAIESFNKIINKISNILGNFSQNHCFLNQIIDNEHWQLLNNQLNFTMYEIDNIGDNKLYHNSTIVE
uniref:Uncharacterized protein n=1 Tax=Romanomermis culicivorax TaxID=13658 RepID=A0A915HWM4_ROMCU